MWCTSACWWYICHSSRCRQWNRGYHPSCGKPSTTKDSLGALKQKMGGSNACKCAYTHAHTHTTEVSNTLLLAPVCSAQPHPGTCTSKCSYLCMWWVWRSRGWRCGPVQKRMLDPQRFPRHMQSGRLPSVLQASIQYGHIIVVLYTSNK